MRIVRRFSLHHLFTDRAIRGELDELLECECGNVEMYEHTNPKL